MSSVINALAVTGGKPEDKFITCFQGGRRHCLSLARLDADAGRLAGRLLRAGLKPGDRVGLLARNGIEWILVDLAAIKAGLVTAGFEWGKFSDSAPLVDRYALDAFYTESAGGSVGPALDLRPMIRDILEAAGDAPSRSAPDVPPPRFYGPGDITTIKFTSGSTGEPKGLAATVGSIASSLNAVQAMFAHGAADNILVFLPLSLLQQRYWVYSALAFGHDVTVAPFELAVGAAQATQPTVIMGVPGFFDGIRRQVESDGDVDDPDARRHGIERYLGRRIRYLWTGSAPAGSALLHFYNDCGVPLYEGYGMNETCIVTKNHPGHVRIGSVGQVLAGKRIRIDSDGVLIVGADWPVNTSYLYAAPGDSGKVFLPTGEVRTGDLARIDDDGFLYILGRSDDMIVLANGRNVHVRAIEEQIARHPDVHQCVLYGSGRPYLVAIISPAAHDLDRGGVLSHIEGVNRTLAKDDRIVRAVFAPEPFSVENGLLTSQFKPRRKEIHKALQAEIDQQYGAFA
ncbi:MAG: long-chain fatty acid--CoA ligase [Telmatospirillum sp.]|nr:long-chain fatty acid--CoA ligase [Telmatospirillum sp.]